MKRAALVLAATAAIVAVPGVALAVPGEPGQCTGTGYCTIDTPDSNLDGARVVTRPPSDWDEFRAIAGKALADFLFGPQW
jgi:hypothetical protein